MISSSFLAASCRIRVFLTVMLSKILSLRVSNNEAISETLKMVVLVVTGWASVLRMGSGSSSTFKIFAGSSLLPV
jgi:hypothetical protein